MYHRAYRSRQIDAGGPNYRKDRTTKAFREPCFRFCVSLRDTCCWGNNDEELGNYGCEVVEILIKAQTVLFTKRQEEYLMNYIRITKENIDIICSGDLINQCIGSTYGLRELEIPFLGIYGACSTMAEGLIISSLMTENNVANHAIAVTSSHFSTAERQFRFPLSYGGQRTPTSQWTCTASGAVLLSKSVGDIRIVGGCIGKITDMGVNDINNMGSAMAPAAAGTIQRYLTSTGSSPEDYDLRIE